MPALGTVSIVANFHGRRARREMKLTERQLDRLDDEFADTRGVERYSDRMRTADRDTRNTRNAAEGLKQTLGNLFGAMKMLKFPAIISGVRLLTSSLSALTAQATALLGAMGPITGLGMVMPASLFAMASSMGVVKLATQGLGDAIKVLGDENATLEETREALKGLSEPAHKFAHQVADMKKEVLPLMVEAAQKGLLPALGEMLETINDLMPKILPGIRGLSNALGGIVIKLSDLFGTDEFGNDLTKIFKINEAVVSGFGGALVNLIDLFRHLYIAAGPMLRTFAQLIERWVGAKAAAAEVGRETGELTEFFNDAIRIGRNFATTLGAVFQGFANIASIGSGWGGRMGESIMEAAVGFERWTESADGIEKITAWFERSEPIMSAWGRVFTSTVDMLKEIAPSTESIVNALDAISGPGGFMETLGTMGAAFEDDLATKFVELGTAVLELLTIATSLPIGSVVSSMTDFLTLVVDLVEKLPEGAQKLLVWSALMAKITGSMKVLGQMTGFSALIGGLKQVVPMIRGYRAAVAGATLAEGASAGVKKGYTAATIAQTVAEKARTAATVVATGVQKAFNWVLRANPIFLVVAALAALTAGVVWAYNNVDWFRNMIDSLWQWIYKNLWPTLQSFGSWLASVFSATWRWLSDAMGWVVEKAKMVYNWFMQNVWPALVLVGNFVRAYLTLWFRVFSFAIGLVVDYVKLLYTWFMQYVWPALKIVGGFIAGVLITQFKAWWAVIGWVIDRAKQIYNWFSINVLPILQRLGGYIGGALSGHFRGMRDVIGFVVDKVKTLWRWISNNVMPILRTLGGFVGETIVGHFNAMKEAIGWVIDQLSRLIGWATTAMDTIGGVIDKAGSLGGGALNTLTFGHLGGDTARPRAPGGNLASSFAQHASVDRALPGNRRVTNALHGQFPGSDHHKGRALDLQGSNLQGYKRMIKDMGGFAEFHGSGADRHLHVAYGDGAPAASGDTMRPRAPKTSAGTVTPSMVVFSEGAIVVENPQSEMDFQRAVTDGIETYLRDQAERG